MGWIRLVGPCVAAGLLISSLRAPVQADVRFDPSGTALVDGVPFFPVGLYLYHFDSDVLAEVHQQGFNTVIYGVTPKDVDTLKRHGLMTIPYPTEEWLAVKDHPAILSWYLSDEPEGHGKSPADMRKEYERVRALDPTRPAGLCHYLWDALAKYKDSADYVMSDVYPVLAKRTQALIPVSDHIDQIHRIHGSGFPVWPVIQVFGGPDTEDGKWAPPTPVEVRCMTYLALAHGAKGMLFFSYWPKAPRTWAEVGVLCRELHRLTPFLVLPGQEMDVRSPDKAIHTRGIRVGRAGIVIAVNVEPTFRTAALAVRGVRGTLDVPFENRRIAVRRGELVDRLMPYGVHIYQWGETPQIRPVPKEKAASAPK